MTLTYDNKAAVSGPGGAHADARREGFHGAAGSMRGTVRMKGMLVLGCLATAVPAQAGDFFVEKIEPLLKHRCYECHSHPAGKMKGGLTLDAKSGWEQGGDSGPSLVPGKPDESLLIKMVRWTDQEHQMPPKQQLPAEEIALLEEWVKSGAPDPRKANKPDGEWWSLKPLGKPAGPPAGANVNAIDAFISAKLQEKGLAMSPPADPRTLIRRVYFDLIGLPPAPEEVEAFVRASDGPDPADRPDGAYEALVDKLLASPRYGERWARHWLDTIHFADTHGFEHDDLRPHAWRFRDYVIGSLNRDTPWDRFIREQLAADVFYPEETQLTPALGFLGAGNYDSSAAATAPVSFEYLDRDDLVTQTMASFASTTANCARCHNHKFDPISQEDYFALQSVFAGIGKGDITYSGDPATGAERKRLTDLRVAIERQDRAVLLSAENAASVAAWEQKQGQPVPWVTLVPEIFHATEGTSLERLADGSVLASGPVPDKDTYALTFVTGLKEITGFRIDLLTDDSLPLRGPGRAANGNLHLSEFEVQVFRPGVMTAEKVAIRRALSDFDQAGGYDVTKTIDGDPKSSWAIHPAVGVPHYAVFELATPLRPAETGRMVISLRQLQGGSHLLGRFRLSATAAPASSLRALPAVTEHALAKPAEERTPDEKLVLATHVLRQGTDEAMAKLPAPLTVWAAGRAAANERGVITIAEPRTIRILKRGDPARPGAEVPPGALSAVTALKDRFDLPHPKDEASRRAALAAWLADPANPLTWRSVVNRVWHYHFGKGISDSPSDLGRMGGVPSHPELIDWLAVWFRDDAHGSLKALHRLIVTSAAYRQSSAPDPAASAIDPDNRLLWRMNRLRLDADTFRDSVLAASGRLDLTMGGPPVAHFTSKPGPQSTPVLNYDHFDRDSPGASRRSIYRLVWRAIADPFMDALDFPDLGLLSPVRGHSVSALQALALFNNEFVLHSSGHFAARLEKTGNTAEEEIRAAFAVCYQRPPTPEELSGFKALAAQHGLPAACRVLFNSNEFLFVD